MTSGLVTFVHFGTKPAGISNTTSPLCSQSTFLSGVFVVGMRGQLWEISSMFASEINKVLSLCLTPLSIHEELQQRILMMQEIFKEMKQYLKNQRDVNM